MRALPLWIIRQATQADGKHLAKRPRVIEPKEAQSKFEIRVWPRTWEHVHSGTSSAAPLRPGTVGNLTMNEYRFWQGARYFGSCLAVCRACGTKTYSTEARKLHQDINLCTKLLTQAYKLLLSTGHCGVCGQLTKDRKWGVPLCKGCVDNWLHHSGGALLILQDAIATIRKRTLAQESAHEKVQLT